MGFQHPFCLFLCQLTALFTLSKLLQNDVNSLRTCHSLFMWLPAGAIVCQQLAALPGFSDISWVNERFCGRTLYLVVIGRCQQQNEWVTLRYQRFVIDLIFIKCILQISLGCLTLLSWLTLLNSCLNHLIFMLLINRDLVSVNCIYSIVWYLV